MGTSTSNSARRRRVAGKRKHDAESKVAMDRIGARIMDQSMRMKAIGIVPATPRDLLVGVGQ